MQIFKQGIVRKPGANFGDGQTTANLGKPDMERVIEQHMKYVWALFSVNIEVELLTEDVAFPDGCFVEDTAVLTDEAAIICRLGHPKRMGEQGEIADLLAGDFDLFPIRKPGTLDGGDVLRIGKHFFIGQSARTNVAGAQQLAETLKRLGYTSDILPVANGLHLKSGMSYVGDNRLVVTETFAQLPELSAYDLIRVHPEENYAANCLFINHNVIIAEGFPRLADALEKRKMNLSTLDLSEFRKMDGSLTCLSLLW